MKVASRTLAAPLVWSVLVIVMLLVPLVVGQYYVFVMHRFLLLAVLALALNLFQGYCGQVNFGISGFVAFGAYGSGLIEVKVGVHPFVTVLPAMLIGGIVAYLLSYVIIRLRAMSQALGTLAFALTVYSLLNTAVPASWGGGDAGFSLPAIKIFGKPLDYVSTYYVLFGLLVVVFVVCALIVRSPIGRAWTAIREDETAAAASGVDVSRYMRLAFVITCTLAALGGVMTAMQSRYIAPDNVNLFSNILVLLVVVIGGEGSNVGMLVGAALLIAIGEYISSLQNFPTLIYGIILFIVMRFLPRGLWPHLCDAGLWLRGRLGKSTTANEPEIVSPIRDDLVGVEHS